MAGWGEFITAFVVFFASHAIPVRPPVKSMIVRAIGTRRFLIGYSILSTLILIWLIAAAGRAPFVAIWDAPFWMRHLTLCLMFITVGLFTLTVGRPNPFSFGGRNNDAFDPVTSGLIGRLRHPLLICLATWAFAHLLPNGDLAHVILFGVFGGFALLGGKIINRRKKRQMGAQYDVLLDSARRTPIWPISGSSRQFCIRFGIAILLYAGLIVLHGQIIGVAVLF